MLTGMRQEIIMSWDLGLNGKYAIFRKACWSKANALFYHISGKMRNGL